VRSAGERNPGGIEKSRSAAEADCPKKRSAKLRLLAETEFIAAQDRSLARQRSWQIEHDRLFQTCNVSLQLFQYISSVHFIYFSSTRERNLTFEMQVKEPDSRGAKPLLCREHAEHVRPFLNCRLTMVSRLASRLSSSGESWSTGMQTGCRRYPTLSHFGNIDLHGCHCVICVPGSCTAAPCLRLR
jgi:hypothetical protein